MSVCPDSRTLSRPSNTGTGTTTAFSNLFGTRSLSSGHPTYLWRTVYATTKRVSPVLRVPCVGIDYVIGELLRQFWGSEGVSGCGFIAESARGHLADKDFSSFGCAKTHRVIEVL